MGIKNIIGELQVNGKPVLTEKYSEGLSYELSEDSTYYIVTGMGTCTDEELIIPSEYNGLPVKEIGDYAFQYVDNSWDYTAGVTSGGNNLHDFVKKVVIPDSVTKIGTNAFAILDEDWLENFSTTLETVEMGNNVTECGEMAFGCCNRLHEIKLSNALIKISNHMFWRCDALKEINLPKDITAIEPYAFAACYQLTELSVPDKVASIGDEAFAGSEIVKLVIPKSVITIGEIIFGEEAILQAIYCEAETKPDGWSDYWVGEGTPVIWGFVKDFEAVNDKLGDISSALDSIIAQTNAIIGGTE